MTNLSRLEEGKPMKVTYQRSQLSSQSDAVKKEIDPAFFNDQYWLLFPIARSMGWRRECDR